MIGYASHTGTRRNVEALRAAGWRVLLSPFGDSYDLGLAYGIDNPAWPVSQLFERGKRPDRAPQIGDIALFTRLIARRGAGADFIIVPDIVTGGAASLALSTEWLPRLRAMVAVGSDAPQLLIAVQDGMEAGPLGQRARQLIGRADGIFVGGGDPWKEQALPHWAEIKRQTGCYLHVGRVNTARRIALCAAAGADSFDGKSATMFAKSLPALEQAARQPALIGFAPPDPQSGPQLCADPGLPAGPPEVQLARRGDSTDHPPEARSA